MTPNLRRKLEALAERLKKYPAHMILSVDFNTRNIEHFLKR